jgi:hypothetical protein
LNCFLKLFHNVIRSNAMYYAAACHRCTCPNKEFLDTSKSWPPKTTAKVMERVIEEAAGGSNVDAVPVVEMGSDGQSNRPGPGAQSYERSRAKAGAFHLLFNAFWLVSTFCIFQMYMRDSLHQVDHGIFLHVCRGILRLYLGESQVMCNNM